MTKATERKTMKVLDYQNNGQRFVCIKHLDATVNPYKIYRLTWDMGWHRKKLEEYGNMRSVFAYLWNLID